jgi:ABC-type sulfate transport system substrate-binding protein
MLRSFPGCRVLLAAATLVFAALSRAFSAHLLNMGYDVSREFYKHCSAVFADTGRRPAAWLTGRGAASLRWETCRQYLRAEAGQEQAPARHATVSPKLGVFTVDEVLGSWGPARKQHFNDGGFTTKL